MDRRTESSTPILQRHLWWSLSVYLLFATGDCLLTIRGIVGDIAMEGNPIMRWMLLKFGIVGGLVLEKGLVLAIALVVAVVAFRGIHNKAGWVYTLALTPMTRAWMKRKRRHWVAFIPTYFVAAAQALAVISWLYILIPES